MKAKALTARQAALLYLLCSGSGVSAPGSCRPGGDSGFERTVESLARLGLARHCNFGFNSRSCSALPDDDGVLNSTRPDMAEFKVLVRAKLAARELARVQQEERASRTCSN
jgi:hypothetical protein